MLFNAVNDNGPLRITILRPSAPSQLMQMAFRSETEGPKRSRAKGSGAKLVGIGSGVISGLKFTKPIRRLAAAEGDNANDKRYSKRAGW